MVIPTLNEAAHIGGLLERLLADAPAEVVEIWVADGGSTDGTPEIVAAAAASNARIRLIHNPLRLQAAGVNLVGRAADARALILVRMDAHAGYPSDFVANVARVLETTGADSVVVRLRTVGEGCFQKAVAAVSNSRLGTGGAAHRVGGASRWIDHGHHAAFRRDRFVALGGYDETFGANEDAEFDVRLRRAGGRIWFAADVGVDYFPRTTPSALARQYFRYGVGRARNWRKNGDRLAPRQLIPPMLLVGLLLSVIAAPFVPLTLLFPVVYGLAVAIAGVAFAAAARDPCLCCAAVALPAMHLAWGAGFIVGASGAKAGSPASTAPDRDVA